MRGHGLGRWDGDGPILLGRRVNTIWVLKMIFAVLRSTSPKRDVWCNGRRASLSA